MRIVWVRVFYLLSGLVWLAAAINALVTIDDPELMAIATLVMAAVAFSVFMHLDARRPR